MGGSHADLRAPDVSRSVLANVTELSGSLGRLKEIFAARVPASPEGKAGRVAVADIVLARTFSNG